MIRILAIFLLLLLLSLSLLHAQTPDEKPKADFSLDQFFSGSLNEKKAQEKIKGLPLFIETKGLEERRGKKGEYVLIATEGVHAWQEDKGKVVLDLRCDQAVIWLIDEANEQEPDPDTAGERQNEKVGKQKKDKKAEKQKRQHAQFYAEGNVHFRTGKDVLQGEKIFFDQKNNRGIVLSGKLRAVLAGGREGTPFFLRANEIRMHSKEKLIAEGAIISTCQFGDPHYRFATKRVEVIRQKDSAYIRSRDNTIYASKTPLFYLPYIAGEADYNWPLKSVRYGNSSRFGHHLLTTWGGHLYEAPKDEPGPLHTLDWTLDLDIREERGLAFGPGLLYEGVFPQGSPFFGELSTYYAHDQPLEDLGESLDGEDDPNDDDDATLERLFRIYYLHRQKFPGQLTVDAEISHFSDEELFFDFFEKEAREEKEPETYINIKKIWTYNQASTLLASANLNDFLDQVVFLPKFNHRLIQQQLFHSRRWGHTYFNSDFEVSNVRREDDEDDPGNFDGERLARVDWNNVVSHRLQLGAIQLLPFVGGRVTYFERDIDDDYNITRGVVTAGITAATNFFRLFLAHSDLFQLNNILHVFTPEVTYQYIESSVDADDLIPFDAIEEVDDFQEVRVRLINRLKTIRNGVAINFVIFEILQSYFPDQGGEFEDKLSNLEVDLLWSIRTGVTLSGEAEYSYQEDAIERATMRLRVKPFPRLSASADIRYTRDVNFVVTGTADYIISPKWSFAVKSQYDFEEEGFLENSVAVRRVFHRFILDMEFVVDEVDDNVAFNIAVAPLDFISRRTFAGYTEREAREYQTSERLFNQGY